MPYIPTMPKNRIFSALGVALLIPVLAWAQAPAPEPPASPKPTAEPAAGAPAQPATAPAAAAVPELPPTEVELFLDDAIKAVAALKTVSADVVQKVDMLDQKFEISGRYRKGLDNRLYLLLKIHGLPAASGELLQVCDGQTLWDYQVILDAKSYRKIEIAKVLERLKSPELDEEIRNGVTTQLYLKGPDELLKGLRKGVRFDQKESVTIDGKDYWRIAGEWKSREGLYGPNQAIPPPTAPLPPFVPSLVVVYLGKQDSWPYKVELIGRTPSVVMDNRRIGPDGRPQGTLSTIQKVKPTRIEINYTNVLLNTDLRAAEFDWQPPSDVKFEDGTPAILSTLDQAIQLRAAKKKAEAAKSEDPLLKSPIEVPRASDPGPAAPAPVIPSANPKP